MPKEMVRTCFESITIAHVQGDDYHDKWYDAIDMKGREERKYFFTPPRVDGDIYITVETYPSELVPSYCTSGTDPEGVYYGDINSPLLTL